MPLATQAGVLVAIAVLTAVGVYGLVAGIVKLDDAGLYLSEAKGAFKRSAGAVLLWFAPYLMKTLSVVGTTAMFLVGGGLLAHGLAMSESLLHQAEVTAAGVATFGDLLATVSGVVINGLLGLVAGAILVALLHLVKTPGKGETPTD
ncbi:MAG: DUF808 family protein [Gammaproteobacteria bacterium]|nr:DUF808 family protein [Gammaproteobacteria bacterium]